ncbi:MAG: sugar MFS transporter [Flavobacteriaceae bacterium]|nr:sugar MFS transporter [Flavobacteriaceae bacterium]
MSITSSKYTKAFIFLTTLFFLWGFITVLVDSLIPRIRELFTLTYFQAGLVQFAFFGAYLVLSIPSGFVLSKIGYKKGIVVGLLTMAIGCLLFYSAASYRSFSVFLVAYFVLAGGITILQVAANPYVAVLGEEQKASSRLNLAQAFNSLGTAIAPAFGALFLLSDSIKSSLEINALSETAKEAYYFKEAAAVQTPFLALAFFVFFLAIVFSFVKLPIILNEAPKHGYAQLLQKKSLVMGAIGIFIYVGAEVAIGSYLVNYLDSLNLATVIRQSDFLSSIVKFVLGDELTSIDNYGILGAFVTLYWSGAMIGRFIGAYLTQKIKPSKVLMQFAIGAIMLVIISLNSTGLLSMFTILAVGLFNSIMFPTIFTLSLEGLEELKPQASGLLCTMIVGGAIIPPMFGYLTDVFGFQMALTLIVLCYFYIFNFGRIKTKLNT